MTLKQLEYFIAVIDTGSISAAAKKMHISQPPLSMQIKILEEELGTVLFERSTRYIRPTDDGMKLYHKGRVILDLVAEAETEIRDDSTHLEGKLIIGTISSCGNILLGPAMQHFVTEHPDVSYELVEGNTFTMLDKIQKRELDIAFVRTPYDSEGLTGISLTREPMCAIGRSFFLKNSGSISMEELACQPLIIYRRFEKMLNRVFASKQLAMNVRCLNDDARTTLMWAAAGVGVGIMPKSIVSLLEHRELIICEIDAPELITEVHLVHRKGQYISTIARKFMESYIT